MSKTNSTYVPLSRGLEEHIPDMNAQACRIYIYMLIKAKAIGTDKGKFNISIGLLANDLKMHRVTMQKIITDHLKNKYISIKPGKNQHSQTEFTILKYKTVHDFACSVGCSVMTTSKEQPPLQASNKQVTSTVENSNDNTGLQAPKKLRSKEVKEVKKNLNNILDFWNSQKIIIHKPSPEINKAITAALKTYSESEILEAITNYSKILNSSDYWLTHRWTLITFLTQKQKNSIETFLNTNKPLERYKNTAHQAKQGFKGDPEVWKD